MKELETFYLFLMFFNHFLLHYYTIITITTMTIIKELKKNKQIIFNFIIQNLLLLSNAIRLIFSKFQTNI